MKIFDCFMYFDEDLLLDLRFNILDKFVDRFVIVESEFTHQGKKKNKNFDIKKFKRFSDKIIYNCIDKFPDNLTPSQKDNFQRNYIYNCLESSDDDDLVILSDIDEIPNLKNFKYNYFYKYYFFRQKFFYYKLNLLNLTCPDWYGSRICKKKFLRSPQWFRDLKPRRDSEKKYPVWRIDKLRHSYIDNGGWHFSFLKDSIGIKDKLESFAHVEFNNDTFNNLGHIERCLNENKDIFNRNYTYKKIPIDHQFPDYIKKNILSLSKWIL